MTSEMDERYDDDEVDAILASRGVDPDLEGVFGDLNQAFVHPLPEDVNQSHLHRLLAVPAPSPEGARSPWGRRFAVAGFGVAAFLIATTSLASADALPGPIQDAVANVVEPLGIDLPHSDDANESDSDPAEGSDTSVADTPSVTAPGQTGDTPSDTAPGQTGDTPSDTAPGGGKPDTPPTPTTVKPTGGGKP